MQYPALRQKSVVLTKRQRQINNLKYGIMLPFLFLIITNAVGRRLKDKNMKGIIPKGYVVMVVKVLPQNHYLLINVSSTNSEQSKLCINGSLYIDAWLLWKQAIGRNGT